MGDWVKLLTDVGFPIFVAGYVLLRIEPAIKELTKAIVELRVCLVKSHGSTDDRARGTLP